MSPDEFNAFFYSLVSQDTMEMYYASKRQRFLINQGYSYKVINKLGNLENENLSYSRKDEQIDLLKEVLAANESEADVEDAQSSLRPNASSHIFRSTGAMGSISGADEGIYMESRRNKEKTRHPLFKKFMGLK